MDLKTKLDLIISFTTLIGLVIKIIIDINKNKKDVIEDKNNLSNDINFKVSKSKNVIQYLNYTNTYNNTTNNYSSSELNNKSNTDNILLILLATIACIVTVLFKHWILSILLYLSYLAIKNLKKQLANNKDLRNKAIPMFNIALIVLTPILYMISLIIGNDSFGAVDKLVYSVFDKSSSNVNSLDSILKHSTFVIINNAGALLVIVIKLIGLINNKVKKPYSKGRLLILKYEYFLSVVLFLFSYIWYYYNLK